MCIVQKGAKYAALRHASVQDEQSPLTLYNLLQWIFKNFINTVQCFIKKYVTNIRSSISEQLHFLKFK